MDKWIQYTQAHGLFRFFISTRMDLRAVAVCNGAQERHAEYSYCGGVYLLSSTLALISRGCLRREEFL